MTVSETPGFAEVVSEQGCFIPTRPPLGNSEFRPIEAVGRTCKEPWATSGGVINRSKQKARLSPSRAKFCFGVRLAPCVARARFATACSSLFEVIRALSVKTTWTPDEARTNLERTSNEVRTRAGDFRADLTDLFPSKGYCVFTYQDRVFRRVFCAKFTLNDSIGFRLIVRDCFVHGVSVAGVNWAW